MSQTVKKIFEEALALAEDERAELVAELLNSLPPCDSVEERSDEDWIAEVERRARTALAGSPGVSWDETREKITKQLARNEARTAGSRSRS
jgi:putative addiction module component (TIGR02574 family)